MAVEEAQNLCLLYNCQFYEVAAAESYSGVHLAFQSLLKEARSASLQRSLPIRRKLGVNSVSKVNMHKNRRSTNFANVIKSMNSRHVFIRDNHLTQSPILTLLLNFNKLDLFSRHSATFSARTAKATPESVRRYQFDRFNTFLSIAISTRIKFYTLPNVMDLV